MSKNNNTVTKTPDVETVDGRTTRYASHRIQRREALLEQTTALLAKYGLRALAIDDIVERLDIAKPALYRYFSSKEDLIRATLTRAREDLVEADMAADNSDWRLQLLGAIRFIAVRPEAFIVLYRHAANDPEYHSYFKAYFDQASELTLERLVRFSANSPDMPVSFDFCARALVSFIFSATLTWIEDGAWEIKAFHKWLVLSAVALTESWTVFTFESAAEEKNFGQ
jgi:AcrR family transcriptional regulator